MNGRSQAVRLPKLYRFEGKEVYIKKTRQGVLLIPKEESLWDAWEQNLMRHEENFMLERNQPKVQHRSELHALFD